LLLPSLSVLHGRSIPAAAASRAPYPGIGDSDSCTDVRQFLRLVA